MRSTALNPPGGICPSSTETDAKAKTIALPCALSMPSQCGRRVRPTRAQCCFCRASRRWFAATDRPLTAGGGMRGVRPLHRRLSRKCNQADAIGVAMNLELRPAMSGEWRPPSRSGEEPIDFGEKRAEPLMSANSDDAETEKSALALLELENSGLRRLVVELIEKNQRLREQLHSRRVPAGGDSQPFVPSPR